MKTAVQEELDRNIPTAAAFRNLSGGLANLCRFNLCFQIAIKDFMFPWGLLAFLPRRCEC